MGRLIDADAYRDDFMQDVYEVLSNESDNIKANLIIDAFDRIPIAYDEDAVVEQLEKEIEWYEIHGCNNDLNRGIIGASRKAIEIVRGGGIE